MASPSQVVSHGNENILDEHMNISTIRAINILPPPSYINPAFLDDDSKPPPYSLIYPSESNANLADLKPNSSTNFGLYEQDAFQADRYEPIRYEDMFYSGDTSSSVPSCRFLFQNAEEMLPVSSSVFDHQNNNRLTFGRNSNLSAQALRESKIRKGFNMFYSRTYLLRHFVLISLISLTLIFFQVVLINYQAILSHLASGIWCGLFNLATLVFTLITSKLDSK